MSLEFKLGAHTVPFDVWRPGRILAGSLIALDTETECIRDGEIPALVLITATDGQQGFFIARQDASQFVDAHPAAQWILHNAAFDIHVLARAGCDLHPQVESGRVYDTGLLYRLVNLADRGTCHGQWSLDHVALDLLGFELPKDVKSQDGQDVRTTYARFIKPDGSVDYPALLRPEHRPYLLYAAGDPVATFLVAQALNQQAQNLFQCQALDIFDRNSYSQVGPQDGVQIGPAWQVFGFLTHDVQFKGALALATVERTGMALDLEQVQVSVAELDHEISACLGLLKREFDWSPGNCSSKRLDAIFAGIERELGALPRTEKGKYSRAADDLEEFSCRSPFLRCYLRYQELNKIRNTFLDPLVRSDGRVRGRFNVLVNTGRTSCSGKRGDGEEAKGLNLQNLPRDGAVRSCFVPTSGHLLFACDYSMIELVTLAQQCLRKFGWSHMADAIRKNADLHCVYAARRQGIPIDHLPSWDKATLLPLLGPDGEKQRTNAKAPNFGYPGGLGAQTFVLFAQATYGVELTVEEARDEKFIWLDAWPEIKLHLASDDMQLLAVQHADLWAAHPNVRWEFKEGEVPWTIHIFRGVLQGQTCTVTTKRPYTPEEIDWAWAVADQILQRSEHISPSQRLALTKRVQDRVAGRDLWSALAPRQRFVATLTGRLRGYPSYCAARNCVFQGLAADGAKLALYRLYREGFRIVNFIHDEVLVEFPVDSDHTVMADRVKTIMIEEMRKVVLDLPVDCEYALMTRWKKGAKAVFVDGALVPAEMTPTP